MKIAVPVERKASRSPQGERGLKHGQLHRLGLDLPSLPARGAWVETRAIGATAYLSGSLPARGAWVETAVEGRHLDVHRRRSPQGERGLKRL